MLQRIDGDEHQLCGLYIVFPMALGVEGARRSGLRPSPLQPTPQVFLCDQSQLQEAVEIATGEGVQNLRVVQVVPLRDMLHVAKLLQHGLLGWLNSMHLTVGGEPPLREAEEQEP